MDAVTYYHFLCDQHEVVIANGAETESLYPGPEALKSVGREAMEEIFGIFPELAEINYKALSARKLTNGRKGKTLAARHMRNEMPLVTDRRNSSFELTH